MSRGVGVNEIFSSKRNTSGFQFDEKQESKQQLKLSKKKPAEPMSPMKKFGGYKPKILVGDMNFLEIESHTSPDLASPTSPGSTREVPQNTPNLRPQPVSSKPWVVGDKDVPMVLGPSNDEDDNDSNNSTHDVSETTSDNSASYNDSHNKSVLEANSSHKTQSTFEASISQRTYSTSSDTSTLVRQSSDDSGQGTDNLVIYQNGFNSEEDLTSSSAETSKDTNHYVNTTNDVRHKDPIGVYIPPPDYDEDEKTLDFNSEDTDDPSDGGEEVRSHQIKPKTVLKFYEGADLSHFLTEDEPEQPVVASQNLPKFQNKLSKKSKPESQKVKTTEKQSLFKQLSSNNSKRKSTGSAPTFNSVRSFSYADSKFGIKGKSIGKSFSSSNLGDESDIFLSTNAGESSYESFLRSRHGEDLQSNENYVRSDTRQADGVPKLQHKDDPMWKKLTVRIKRMSKSFH